MDTSARLGLPYLAAGQLQKHITVNEALTRLDVLVQCRVASRSAELAPAEAPEGELHILAEGATTGGWAAFAAGDLVRAEPGGWAKEITPDGLVVLVADEDVVLIRSAGAWHGLGARLGEVQGLERLGLNTTADADNPLAARISKALFTAPGGDDGGDLRFTLNKAASDDVLSLLFQSNWQGRAEVGLVGDDDLVLKVADDAGVWREALRFDRATGRAGFAFGAGRSETVVLTESGLWSPPDWARSVEVRITAGGGGGGLGAFSPLGVARLGGGGGGAGGLAMAVWTAAQLEGGLTIEIGEGGAAGSPGAPEGSDGQATTVAVGGAIRLRAMGGLGGKDGAVGAGEAGAGGWGLEPANGGGEGGGDALAEAGASRERGDGPGGGGGGGGLDAAGTASAGAEGGIGAITGAAVEGGEAGLGAEGGDGADADDLWLWAGGGGGGGGASASAGGHDGGDGGPGAGGGGGGAGLTAAGAGGRGGDGRVILTVWG